MGVIEINALNDEIHLLKTNDPLLKLDISGTDWLNVNMDTFKSNLLKDLNSYSLNIAAILGRNQYQDVAVAFLDYTIEATTWTKGFVCNMFYVNRPELFRLEEFQRDYRFQEEGIPIDPSGKQYSFDTIESILYRYMNPVIQDVIDVIKYCCELFLVDLKQKLTDTNPSVAIKENKGAATNNLTSFELALRHWYLVKYKIEEYIVPKKVGEKYGHLVNGKNIESHYGGLDKKPMKRIPKAKEFTNVSESLKDYPEIRKAINDQIALL